jgi:hypothetical protein
MKRESPSAWLETRCCKSVACPAISCTAVVKPGDTVVSVWRRMQVLLPLRSRSRDKPRSYKDGQTQPTRVQMTASMPSVAYGINRNDR